MTFLKVLIFAFLYNLLLFSSLISYACVPYNPPDTCETSHGEKRDRFEVRFYEEGKFANSAKKPEAIALVNCIHRLPGSWPRYRIEGVEFYTEKRTEFIDELEIPARGVGVCKVQ